MTISQTKKNSTPIKVYCLPDEKAQIQKNAEASGLSVASFIRKVAMGYQVESIVDIKQVIELSRVNADLGRLGGLLKLWQKIHLNSITIDFIRSIYAFVMRRSEVRLLLSAPFNSTPPGAIKRKPVSWPYM